MVKKLPPAGQCLARPDPKAARYPDDHGHQILDHEYLEVRLPAEIAGAIAHRARDRVERLGSGPRAHLHVPGEHPLVEVGLLVEEAGYDDEGRDGVEHREYADADHELLELVGLGAVVLHDRAYAEERDEAGQQEDGAEDEVDAEGREHEAPEGLDVPEPDVADAREDVACVGAARA